MKNGQLMNVSFVAEVSSNHHQELSRCLAFIDAAAALGCTAVKFQLFKVGQLFTPEVLASSPQHRAREKWELPVEFLPVLSAHCRTRGVRFGCTPFYLAAVEELAPFVDFYKVASYELLWEELLIACAKTGKPVVVSTGMATLEEVEHAVDLLRRAGATDLTVLHCVSGYPAPPDDCNLAVLETLRSVCQCPVGWSDHSVNPGVVARAVHRWGAGMVEFHLDLDREGDEYQTGHCWLPEEIAPVISEIQVGFSADGSGLKTPRHCEMRERQWRADPSDGLRPLREIRQAWTADVSAPL